MKDEFDAFQKFGILKFIQSQRNERGGWSSTQNTIQRYSDKIFDCFLNFFHY